MTSLTINLKGPIYKAFRYPAGEAQMRILPEHVSLVQSAEEIRIIARIRNAEDVIELAHLCDAVENLSDCGWVSIVLPYLPYARADRRFTLGDCFGLQVFGQILASMAPNRVVALDVHSEKAFKYIPELVNISALLLIQQAIGEFAIQHKTADVCVLFPDAGARHRYTLPREIGCNDGMVRLKVLNATKKRNPETGELSGFDVPPSSEIEGRPTIIVDDICDGGKTFLGIGEALGEIPLGLYVTHGIFSQGIGDLNERFTGIWTTDSFYDGRFGRFVNTLDATPMLLKAATQKREFTVEEIGA